MYADYSFYSETFKGTLSEELYDQMEPKAEAYIRYLTCMNGDIFEKAGVAAVQQAVCAAVEAIANNLTVNASTGLSEAARPVASENNDGYSVTFAGVDTSESAEAALRRKVLEAVRIYLLPTGWLSRKVRCGCDHECGYYGI